MAQVTPLTVECVAGVLGRALANPLQIQRKSLRRIEWDLSGDCSSPVFVELFGRRDRDGPIRTRQMAHAWAELWCRCRKCDECRRYRTRQWRARALSEYLDTVRRGGRVWMLTLTMRPDVHALHADQARAKWFAEGCDFDAEPVDTQFRELCSRYGREFTKYLKRVRKVSGVAFRYICVMERHQSGFPHAHALVFEQAHDAPLRKSVLQEQWHLGFSQCKLVKDSRGVLYVTKYLMKSGAARVRASLLFGTKDRLSDRPEGGGNADPRKKEKYAPIAQRLVSSFTGSEHAEHLSDKRARPSARQLGKDDGSIAERHRLDTSRRCGKASAGSSDRRLSRRGGRVLRPAEEHEAEQPRPMDTRRSSPAVKLGIEDVQQHPLGTQARSGVRNCLPTAPSASPDSARSVALPAGPEHHLVRGRPVPAVPVDEPEQERRQTEHCEPMSTDCRLWPMARGPRSVELCEQRRQDMAPQRLGADQSQLRGWPGPKASVGRPLAIRQESGRDPRCAGRGIDLGGALRERIPAEVHRGDGAVTGHIPADASDPGPVSRSRSRSLEPAGSLESAGSGGGTWIGTFPGSWTDAEARARELALGGPMARYSDGDTFTAYAARTECPDPWDGTTPVPSPHASWGHQAEPSTALVAGGRRGDGWLEGPPAGPNAQTRSLLRAGQRAKRGAGSYAAKWYQNVIETAARRTTQEETSRSSDEGA